MPLLLRPHLVGMIEKWERKIGRILNSALIWLGDVILVGLIYFLPKPTILECFVFSPH